MLLFQKADDLREKMIPYVPDKLQGSSAVALGHGSVVSLMDCDFYSQSYQSAFQTLWGLYTLSVDRNCKPRENPNCALAQRTIQVSLGEELQLYFRADKGECALPQVLLVPEMWNSTVKISSIRTEVWHRSFQNMNLFSLMKYAEGAGVGLAKVAADEVKLWLQLWTSLAHASHLHLQPLEREQQGFLCVLRGRV